MPISTCTSCARWPNAPRPALRRHRAAYSLGPHATALSEYERSDMREPEGRNSPGIAGIGPAKCIGLVCHRSRAPCPRRIVPEGLGANSMPSSKYAARHTGVISTSGSSLSQLIRAQSDPNAIANTLPTQRDRSVSPGPVRGVLAHGALRARDAGRVRVRAIPPIVLVVFAIYWAPCVRLGPLRAPKALPYLTPRGRRASVWVPTDHRARRDSVGKGQ